MSSAPAPPRRVLNLKGLPTKPIEAQKHAQVRVGPDLWRTLLEVARRASDMHGVPVDAHLLAEGILHRWLLERGHLGSEEGPAPGVDAHGGW